MVFLPKPVKMYGSSFVITLSRDDRRLLNVQKEGDIIYLSQTPPQKLEDEPDDLDTYD